MVQSVAGCRGHVNGSFTHEVGALSSKAHWHLFLRVGVALRHIFDNLLRLVLLLFITIEYRLLLVYLLILLLLVLLLLLLNLSLSCCGVGVVTYGSWVLFLGLFLLLRTD
jgi:hypothetical protein